MGRGKIEIKRIENSNNRQVTFSKRRTGILKKATEITVLCDAHVSLVIFATSGKMHEYCSPSTTVIDILDRYHKQSTKKLWDPKHENLSNEVDRVKKENDNMQIELRHLKGEDVTSLSIKELIALEETLENGLASIRDKQMELPKRLKKRIDKLEDENRQLTCIASQYEMDMEDNVREMGTGYHQRGGYNSQIPYAFRVQPIQPNLQDRI
uniref:MADS box transcription factor PISTILLATA1 n=1 Tax=Paeonia lactiflora TaxID=35924 RepID=A0A1Q1NK95_PAELC|nr:MADS box transcription factor PISTILLATA1 [Paeonia lactiflora]AQM56620.1 MADS box transcription factor PISTILLATA1 [Paeonia lactiflora]AQM56622.1 MADS box transcription factor PISTILLATA1 [Paeonia lactiflora]AQM56623.1 MADS box transcription factor PISTILLATA1 [Paeonia lactiflora]AQM56624.1 MADS box transcription factor PISTILLATA1 [Paeonia lactiflora]